VPLSALKEARNELKELRAEVNRTREREEASLSEMKKSSRKSRVGLPQPSDVDEFT